LGVGIAAALLVVGPWVGYNLSRFKDPVYVTSGLGVTLASANCDGVYRGPFEGYWSLDCALAAPIDKHADESIQGSEAQRYALDYVRTHESRIVPVELAREGRAFGFFHPLQQMRLDSAVETRPYHWALLGLGMYYAMLVLSIGGVVILRRRRIPVLPLLAVGLDVVLSVGITFGTTRYRSTFEVSLVLLSAVEVDWIWSHLRRARRASLRPDGDHGDVDGSSLPPVAVGNSGRTDRGEPWQVELPAPAG
jgi:hypothetical protein